MKRKKQLRKMTRRPSIASSVHWCEEWAGSTCQRQKWQAAAGQIGTRRLLSGHFKETLNQYPSINSFVFNTPNQANDLDVRTGAIITEETAAAIKFLKNGKVPGLDMVSAEMLKHGRQCLFKEITDLFNSC